ncbi:MAG: hypothetical protein WBA39_08500 [Rivularia sp. (in: cyanobacteria)]
MDKNVKLWEVYSGKCLQIFQGHTSWVNSIAFISDGKIIVSGSSDLLAFLASLSHNKIVRY